MTDSLRILVLGGRGFLGRRTVAALRRIEGAEVVVASRRGKGAAVAVDVLDYSSRTALDGFDFVVNCSDSLVASPERAAEFCLLRGSIFVETCADAAVLEALYHDARAVPEPTGAVVLGVGVFPGLSNLLAAELRAERPDAQRLDVGVRYSPLSHAGMGVCRLMAELLGRPAVRYEAGERVLEPAVTIGGTMLFSGKPRSVLGVGLPESLTLHWTTGSPSTGAFLALVPPIPIPLQRLLALFAPWGLLRLAPVRWPLQAALWVLRCQLLRWRRAPLEISAVVDRGEEPRAEDHRHLRVSGGFLAAAYSVAATVELLARNRPSPGVHVVDQLVGLDDVVERMRALGRGELEVVRG